MNVVEQKLKIPAIIIMVIAGLTILFSIFGIVSNLFLGGGGASNIANQIADPEARRIVEMMTGSSGVMGIIWSIFNAGLNGFVIFGALKMMKGESYPMAMAAAIIYIIPCFSMCCIGMPFGIWALVMLLNDEVKAAFAGGSPGTPGTA